MYIETNLTLDSFDLIQVESLIERRLKELEEVKDGSWVMENIANEQIHNYSVTLKKIKDARKEVKRIKAEADQAFYARKK